MQTKAHKIRLDPTRTQATHFARATGTARFAYNWALVEWQRQYRAALLDASLPKPSEAALRRQLNAVKREQFPWMLDVTKCAAQQGVKDLGTAYRNFFKGMARSPRLKRRGVRDSFYLNNDAFEIRGKKLRVPKLGWVRMHEELRFEGKIMSCTISRTAQHWYASFNVELGLPEPTPKPLDNIVGVDLGVKDLAILSTGEVVPNPRHLSRSAKKIRRLNKELARREKGSKNRAKTKAKLAQAHYVVACQRADSLHKLTNHIVQNHDVIAIEDLNVAGMLKNRSLARAVQDASFGEIRRQLEYKAAAAGTHVVVVDRWFPSSKLCSTCGVKNQDLTLSPREWTCSTCGARHDRDINAARNLAQYAREHLSLAASSAVTACGEGSSGSVELDLAKLPSLKQEPDSMVLHA